MRDTRTREEGRRAGELLGGTQRGERAYLARDDVQRSQVDKVGAGDKNQVWVAKRKVSVHRAGQVL